MKNSIQDGVIDTRIQNLREKLKQNGLCAALVTQRENYIYLSGFNGTFAHLLISMEDLILVTDFRYIEQAELQAPMYEIIQCRGNLIDPLNNVIKEKNIKKLGFEDLHLTYGIFTEYREKLKPLELIPLGRIIEDQRIIKDAHEIDIIKKAAKISDNAFSHILEYIKPGVKEIEIAAEIEYFMKKSGARGPSFATIVASGERAALPHGVASEKRLKAGEAVVLDYGAYYNDYCSDITRTVFIGKPAKELERIYKTVLDAQLKSIEGAKEGIAGKDIDFIARDYISQNGYGNNFGHGLGHGVGLEIHEEPRFSPTGSIITRNGMTVTVEPGIYVSGLGGVRIEDLIVIKGEKPLILTNSTKEMIII